MACQRAQPANGQLWVAEWPRRTQRHRTRVAGKPVTAGSRSRSAQKRVIRIGWGEPAQMAAAHENKRCPSCHQRLAMGKDEEGSWVFCNACGWSRPRK